VDACLITRTGCLRVCDDSSECPSPMQCDPQEHVCGVPCL
jgi:hypothetical protein